jgi:hypothetical protein
VRVHLATEHALELELAHFGLDRGQIAFDLERRPLVVFGFGEFEQFDGVADRICRRVDLFDFGGELGSLFSEFLGFFRLLPDRRIFEFAADFFEPLFLQIVFKETPLRS